MTITIDQLRAIMAKAEVSMKDPAEFDPNLPLREQGLDSLDMATFVFFLETELNLNIPHREYPRLVSLQEIVSALAANGEDWVQKK